MLNIDRRYLRISGVTLRIVASDVSSEEETSLFAPIQNSIILLIYPICHFFVCTVKNERFPWELSIIEGSQLICLISAVFWNISLRIMLSKASVPWVFLSRRKIGKIYSSFSFFILKTSPSEDLYLCIFRLRSLHALGFSKKNALSSPILNVSSSDNRELCCSPRTIATRSTVKRRK